MRAKGTGESTLLLLDVIDLLNRLRIPYAVVGAFAASFYGVVRVSMDADAVISVKPGQAGIRPLLDKLRKAGLKTTYRKGDIGDPIGAVVNVEDGFENRVDLLMNIRGMREDLFSRTVESKFTNVPIRLIGVEDFIAMKIFAGSPKDLDDALGVLKVSSGRIKLPLLKELAQRYGKAASHKLQDLLRKVPR